MEAGAAGSGGPGRAAARLVTSAELSGMVMFAVDRDWRSVVDVARLEAGQLLEKSGAILAGALDLYRPCMPERLLVFAKGPAAPVLPEDNPWNIAALDRKAYFAVGDAFDAGTVVQHAVVEVSEDEAAAGEPIAFAPDARDYARGLLASSLEAPVCPYAGDGLYQAAMGNGQDEPWDPARRCIDLLWPLDLEWLRRARGRREAGEGLGELQAARRDLVGSAPEHELVQVADGTFRARARRRRDDADEAVIAAEAARNLDVRTDQVLSIGAVKALHRGERLPTLPGVRAAVRRSLAFEPAEHLVCDPWLSTERDLAIGELDAAYELRKMEDPDAVVELERLEELKGSLGAMFDGDVEACSGELRDRLSMHEMPYRLEMSWSPDYGARLVDVNVFAPPRSAFPLEGPPKDPVKDPVPYDAKRFERLYSDAVCSLAAGAARVVKGHFPWAERIRLCTWAREEGGVRCLVALDAPEEAAAGAEGRPASAAPRALGGLGARIDMGRDHVLRPVEPLFATEDALDYRFGFTRLLDGWPLPPRAEGEGEAALEDDAYMMRALIGGMLERGTAEDALAIAEEQIAACEAAWLDSPAPEARALSCDSRLNEEAVRAAFGPSGITFLPHGLAHLHCLRAQALNLLEDLDGAREAAEAALSLNSGCFDAHMLLDHLDIVDGDYESAERHLEEAHRFAQSASDLCEVMVARAFFVRAADDPEGAAERLLFALSIADDVGDADDCLYMLGELRDLCGYEVDPADLEAARRGGCAFAAELTARGVRAGLSPEVEAAARRGVAEMLSGGPVSDEAHVSAYVLAERLAGRDVLDARRLRELVTISALGSVPAGDYMGKPVALYDRDLALDFEDALDVGGLGCDDACPVAVPRADGQGGVRFEMRGLVDSSAERVVARVVTDSYPIVRVPDYGRVYFRLLQPERYPELGL